MKVKLTPELCYLAGLVGKGREEGGAVGIKTRNDEITERFVKLALELGIDTKKVLIEEREGLRHVYFYHSKLAKQLREIRDKETVLFKYRNLLAANYVAGIFDANGHFRGNRITLNGLNPKDNLMLQNLGIHTTGRVVLNIKNFISLINEYSVLLSLTEVKGAKL